MIWGIIYGVMALITFIGLTIVSSIDAEEKNSMLIVPMFKVPLLRIVILSIVWPSTLLYIIILWLITMGK